MKKEQQTANLLLQTLAQLHSWIKCKPVWKILIVQYAWFMSHTCRRSFCTNEFLDGTPSNLIMAISGHKTEKAFRRYIKADQV